MTETVKRPIQPRRPAVPLFDYLIVGGGIVGLSVGLHVARRWPDARIAVLEKEMAWARHQTGHNSGVIHSGIYYRPGSLKARFARDGCRTMVEFCQEHHIPYDVCGKVIVATVPSELPLLEQLYRRGLDNGLTVKRLTAQEVQEREPHVRCLAGIAVPSTGITDYVEVAHTYARLLERHGATLCLGAHVTGIRDDGAVKLLQTDAGEFRTRFLINCCGLQSDRVARMDQVDPDAQIVPFRGEYFQLIPERADLIKGLVYPVPNPAFPFLGVHFTRMIDGSVHAGPNAVLAFKREGYRKSDVSLRDLRETFSFEGFWKLAAKHAREGANEMWRSVSKAAFVRSLQALVPEIRATDLVPCHAGVRAQAVQGDGRLVDDFLIVHGQHSLHVCNAPSPGATASLEIGRAVAELAPSL